MVKQHRVQHRTTRDERTSKENQELRHENQKLKRKLARAQREITRLTEELQHVPEGEPQEVRQPEKIKGFASAPKCSRCQSLNIKELPIYEDKVFRICEECGFREKV